MNNRAERLILLQMGYRAQRPVKALRHVFDSYFVCERLVVADADVSDVLTPIAQPVSPHPERLASVRITVDQDNRVLPLGHAASSLLAYAKISFITFPPKSVSFSWRPLCRYQS